MQDLSQLECVVVLSMENRSFDHVFGGLANEHGNQGTIDVANRDLWTNTDRDGKEHGIGELSDALAGVFDHDPDHGWQAVEKQVARNSAGVGTMGGFVRDWVDVYRNNARPRDAVLAYLQRHHQPVSYFFAEEYAVLERYFASVATGTMPNRFYALAGDAAGHRDNAISKQLLLDLRTVFDTLPADTNAWRVYTGALPTLAMVGGAHRKRANFKHIRRLSQFAKDAEAGSLPRLSWLEPVYSWSSHLLARLFRVPDGQPNDDHPPSHTARGQKLFHDVYTVLTADPARWQKTLLIIHYDEHGGFFDHVSPPAIAPGDVRTDGIKFFGPRVPAWLISPFAPRAGRIKQQFDHCSILRFIAEWFGVTPVGRANSANTASIAGTLLDAPRTDPPKPAPAPPIQPKAITAGEEPPASTVERGAVAFLDELEAEDPELYKALQDALAPTP